MFIDEAKIYVRAGDGGNGCDSFQYDKAGRRRGPNGGDGGKGGDLIFTADGNVQTLLDFQFRQHFKAESGRHGSSNDKRGRSAEDLYVKVPPGTVIKDNETGLVLRDLAKAGDRVIAAKGGRGGRGNSKYRQAEKGAPGEEKTLLLELRLIADVGIVGYPNAGKSTLISRISSARPRIADYPFTTKAPVLGVVKLYVDAVFVAAEIPGLIEGAHLGKGLGDRFLRHVERTKVLIHLIDGAGLDGRAPHDDYEKLNRELSLYSAELMEKPQVIALNKMDLTSAAENMRKFKSRSPRKKVFPVSALTGSGVKELLREVWAKLREV